MSGKTLVSIGHELLFPVGDCRVFLHRTLQVFFSEHTKTASICMPTNNRGGGG